MSKTVIFVPSYCLSRDKSRLTAMNEESMVQAAPIALRENATIIISTGYTVWKKEADLRIGLLTEMGVSRERIVVIGGVTNSYGETEMAKEIIRKEGFEKIVIVSEKWHSPRILKTFQHFFPKLQIELKVFESPKFEFTYEPSIIKSFRIGFEFTWALWNKIFEFLTPLILKIKS